MKAKLLFSLFFLSTFFLNAQTALNFDGANDYVVGPNNSSLDLYQATVEGWIKTTDAGTGYRGIIVKVYNFGIYLEDNELMIFENKTGRRIFTDPKINLADGIWHHITLSFNHTVIDCSKLYVDGLLVLTFTYTIPDVDLKKIAIGSGNYDGSDRQLFKGDIDQVRIWNTIRTDAEILASYNKCLTGNETGLLMLWQFEEGTGTIATDLSGNNNHGTLTNMDSANWVSGYDCSNLVAYYPFNGNANDESGNNLNGTVSGATLTTDRFGNPDSAYSFDGSNVITIAHNNLLNMDNELSISVWIKPNSLQNAMILGKSNYLSNTNYLLRTKSTVYIAFEYKDFANSNSLPLIVNDWNHVVVVSNTDNSKQVYINGVLATHTSASSPYGLVTNELTIGARPGNEFFNGSIDDIRIYKSALSASDASSLYNNNSLEIEDKQLTQNNNFYVFNNTLYFNQEQDTREVKNLSIYNILAQNVFQTKTVQNELLLNFLGQGIYILKVEFNNGSTGTKKIIIK